MAFLAAFAFFALGYLAQDVVMSPLTRSGPGDDHGIPGDHGLVKRFFLEVEGGDEQLPSKASFFVEGATSAHLMVSDHLQGSTLAGHSQVWSQLATG